jgi:ABC-type multidrug transport system permease subunit
MFNLYVQQNQWIVLALMAGIGLMLIFWLTYLAMWRPREDESIMANMIKITGINSFFRWVVSFFPWVLIVLVFISIMYTLAHTIAAIIVVPNW